MDGEQSRVLQMGQQLHLGMADFYAEQLGLNRESGEDPLSYVMRVMTSERRRDTNCMGLTENVPGRLSRQNSFLRTHDHTFYFSMSTGERKKLREKRREVFEEPIKLSR